MKVSKDRIIRILAMLAFLVCMFFANIYAVRKIMQYGMEAYFYDKLSVASNIGGAKGIEEELKKMRTDDKMPRELPLVGDFEARLKTLKDPGAFLNGKVEESRKRINFIRSLRTAAIILMFFIFTWRLAVNLHAWFKRRSSSGNPFKR